MYIINFEEIVYHQRYQPLHIIIAKVLIHVSRDDIQSKRTDDIPLLSQWIKKRRVHTRRFLVDVRRIELLSKNLFIPASPSADISLHSLLQPLNVELL